MTTLFKKAIYPKAIKQTRQQIYNVHFITKTRGARKIPTSLAPFELKSSP
jgi:hypothetical protein